MINAVEPFGSLRRFSNRLPVLPGAMLLLFVLAGALGPLLWRVDPTRIDLAHALVPPVFAGGGDWAHPFGTDELGRDVLSRLLAGARISLTIAVAVVFLSGLVGTAVAMAAGYLGRLADSVLMRITDGALAFPYLLLAVILIGTFGRSANMVILILALAGWAQYARVLRSEVLTLRTRDFVTMSIIMGGRPWWVIRRHLLPNVISSFLVLATLQVGLAIVAEGALSFLGIGIPAPAASVGSMLNEGRNYLHDAWWIATLPGLALTLTVLATNLMGEWLRARQAAYL